METLDDLGAEATRLYSKHRWLAGMIDFNTRNSQEEQAKLDKLLHERKPLFLRNHPTWWDSVHWQENQDRFIGDCRSQLSITNECLERHTQQYEENSVAAREHFGANIVGYVELALSLAEMDGVNIISSEG